MKIYEYADADDFFDVIDEEEENGYLEAFDEGDECAEIESSVNPIESSENPIESQVSKELESRRLKLELAEAKQLAKQQQSDTKKRKQFENKIISIIENLDHSFTFKKLNTC